MTRRVFVVGAVVVLGACALQPRPPGGELQDAIEAAYAARTDGPAQVRLGSRLELQLLAGLSYVPPAQAERLLRSMGQRPGRGLLGVVVANASDSTDIAALYAAPELEVRGWKEAPVLGRFRVRY